MAYKIPVRPIAANQYKISFPSDHVTSDHYRTPCIGAIENELISTLQSLRHESELKQGYPGATISASIHRIETALLLLDSHKQQIRNGSPAKTLIGSPPTQALGNLDAYHQKALVRRLLAAAAEGKTHWFTPGHWALLKEVAPNLPPVNDQ